MYFSISPLASAALLAHTVLAFEDALLQPRMKEAMLQARQTDSLLPDLDPSCTSAIFSVYDSLPTPPADLITAIDVGNDPCSITVPASLSSDFSSYSSELDSWYSSNSDDLSSALSECSQLTEYASFLPVCATSLAAEITGTGTDTGTAAEDTGTATDQSATGTATEETATGTDTDTATATGDENPDSTGAAARETGVAAAALAAVGLFAVVL